MTAGTGAAFKALVYISTHSDKPFMRTNMLMKASQLSLCVFSHGGSRCRLRLFAASRRIEPRGPTAVTHLPGRSRGDRATVTRRSLAGVKGTLADGCQCSKHAWIHQTCQLRFEFLLLDAMTLQYSHCVYFFLSSIQRTKENGSTLTSENVFSNERAVYLTRVSACHSSAQITGSAFDVFSPLRMTASSVRQTEKWEMWQLLFPWGL